MQLLHGSMINGEVLGQLWHNKGQVRKLAGGRGES